jgi:hypothetical protein
VEYGVLADIMRMPAVAVQRMGKVRLLHQNQGPVRDPTILVGVQMVLVPQAVFAPPDSVTKPGAFAFWGDGILPGRGDA